MSAYKTSKVFGVRLSSQEHKKIEEIAKEWDTSVSSVLRSFIQSCLYSLPNSPGQWIKQEHSKSVEKPVLDTRLKAHSSKGIEEMFPNVEKEAEINSIFVPKVGRNDKCPCGSGQKYKKCHGV